MGRFNIIERRVERFLREPPTVRGATAVIVTATFVVVLLSGVLMTLIDNLEFPDFGVGLWWAVQTVTTVGYGDVAPQNGAGRLVGAVVVIGEYVFIAMMDVLSRSAYSH